MRTIKQIFLVSWALISICGMSLYAQENQTYILHTIEKGQSLYSIASMYGVSTKDIIRLNPGSDDKIYAGHTLRIPRNVSNTQEETYHTIVSGETLYGLTKKYGVSAQAICEANPGLNNLNFRTGQVIRIPTPEKEVQTSDLKTDTLGIQGPVRPRCRDMHKVKRRETVFSISRKYNITEEQLIAANPEIKNKEKLKRGTFLCIPYPEEAKAPDPVNPPTDKELFTQSQPVPQKLGTLKAALILPFLPDGSHQGESVRMIEYYEGFLMAIDSLKRNGTSIDLYTYNAGSTLQSLKAILTQEELKDMNVIFGPLQQQQIKPLADFAEKHQVRLVIPFTSKDNTVFQNPMVYQVNTPQSYLYSEVYDHFMRQFPHANVIFVEAKDGKDKDEFIQGLKDELKARSIPITSVKEGANLENLKVCLKKDLTNIFIPTSGSNVVLMQTLPQLTLLVRENPEYTIQLFGYPEWQTYTKDYIESFFELDTYFYSSFYTNNLLPAAKRFTENYRKWYGKEMEDRYPKYGMLGFDTGYFFLKGLSRYGNNLEQEVHRINLVPIQTGFKFQRVNNWGGFINKKVFFVHFTKDYELVKLDFD